MVCDPERVHVCGALEAVAGVSMSQTAVQGRRGSCVTGRRPAAIGHEATFAYTSVGQMSVCPSPKADGRSVSTGHFIDARPR